MEFEQLLQLIDKMSASELTGLNYETGDVSIRLMKEKEVVQVVAQGEPVAAMAVPAVSAEKIVDVPENSEEVKVGEAVNSPLVGTFYAAPAEDAAPYVSVGDTVKKGQTLAIVEAMKLMNEIESEYDGVVEEICVENGQPVEYGQTLFRIRH